MNLLFFTDADVTVNKGGVNRVTHFLSRKFMERPGWSCHLAYIHESEVLPVSSFDGKVKVPLSSPENTLRTYIRQNRIATVILNLVVKQNIRLILPALHRLREEIPELHTIFCYHNTPGAELFGLSPRMGWHYLLHQPRRLHTLQETALHIGNHTPLRPLLKRYLRPKYRLIAENCDAAVLLSPRYIPAFLSITGNQFKERFTAIPNPLSFPDSCTAEYREEKRKEVLIVSRLDEKQKRIRLALDIWREVEKHPEAAAWQLTIVGTGPDETYYRQLTARLGLKRVQFEGRQAPLPYFRKAAIFMMTSLYEGWPLALAEAQQTGTVPVAFDSFAAVHDMIRDGENGLLIPEKKTNLYARQLVQLMKEPDRRKRMAAQAVKDCQIYRIDRIIQKWTELFHSLHKTPD